MRSRQCLEVAEAEEMVSAAKQFALGRGWAVTIAVVDDGGTPIAVLRLDEASPASVSSAIAKAASAALTGQPTKILEEMIRQRPALTTMPRLAVEGGLPLLFKGQRVGGIGVSGVQSTQDAEVAQAGANRFKHE
jgi:glc operon protein GlcG